MKDEVEVVISVDGGRYRGKPVKKGDKRIVTQAQAKIMAAMGLIVTKLEK